MGLITNSLQLSGDTYTSVVITRIATGTTMLDNDDTSLATNKVVKNYVDTIVVVSGGTSGVTSLSTTVSTETSTRTSADTSLTTRISTEESLRTSGVTSLSTAVSSETSIRTSTDTSLTTRVSTEESTRTSADTSLQTRISTEESTRGSADTSLTTRVSTEESVRTSTNTSLTTRISTEESTRGSADTSIVTYVDNTSMNYAVGTGLYTGGIIAIVDSTHFSITSGIGYLVDPYTKIATKLTFLAYSSVTLMTLGATDITVSIGINTDGSVFQQIPLFSSWQQRTIVCLGELFVDPVTRNLSKVWFKPVFSWDASSFVDDSISMGIQNLAGNTISASGSTLSLNVSSGTMYGYSINAINSYADPNNRTFSAISGFTFTGTYHNTVEWVYQSSTVTTIDPTKFSSGGTNLGTVPTDKWSIRLIMRGALTGTMYISYPTQTGVYDTSILAKADLGNLMVTLPDELMNRVSPLCYLLVRSGAVSLSGSTDAVFVPIEAMTISAGGSEAVMASDVSFDNSGTAITSVTAQGALVNLDGRVTPLSTGLSTEISTRTSADTSLTTRISTETSVRASTDTSLSTSALQPWVDIRRLGFVDDTETSVAFNESTYVFTLSGLTSSWSYYRMGQKYTLSGNKTITLPGTPPLTNMYYITINTNDGALISGTTAWTLFDDTITVATIQWNSGNTPKSILAGERHTCSIDRQMHAYLHYTRGTQFVSGGALNGPTLATATDAASVFGVSQTIIADDDIFTTIPAFPRPSGTTLNYLIYYRLTGTTWTWRLSYVPFLSGATSYIQYDSINGLVNGINARWYNSYILFSDEENGTNYYSIILGRNVYTTLALAQAENPLTFDFTGFPIAESIIAYQLTWAAATGNANRGKVTLAATPVKINITSNTTVGSGAGTDHNTLAGLQGGTSGEFYHLANTDYITVTGISTTVSTETSLRTSVDASLSTVISTETSSRTSYDTSLSTAISTEMSLRTSVDNSLSTVISTETSSRTSYDTSLSTAISTETSLRTSGDTSLSISLSTETSLRSSGDTSLTTRISNEESVRTSGNTSLSISLSTETSVRTSTDTSLTTRISNEESTRTSGDTSLSISLSTETSVRTSADTSLTTRVSTEESVRTSNDTSLTTRISNEESTRTSGDTSLTTRISTETSTRISNDDLLLAGVSTEVSNRSSADGLLSTALSTESSTRGSSDTSLSTAISSVATSTGSTSSLSTALSTETSIRGSSDTSLTTVISTSVSSEASTRASVDASLSTRISSGGPGGATALSGLTDVSISSVTDNDVLKWSSGAAKWINGQGGTGGGTVTLHTLSGITGNTSMGTLVSGLTLGMIYISNTGSSVAVVDLGLTMGGNEIYPYGHITVLPGEVTSITVNRRLSNTQVRSIYISASGWTNVQLTTEWGELTYTNQYGSGIGGVTDLAALSDVSLSMPVQNQALTFTSGGTWTNTTITSEALIIAYAVAL